MSLLGLEAVTAHYPGRARQPAVQAVSLAVQPGEVVALLGANGAGKSTLLRLASGLLRPASGRVLLEGRDLRALSPREVAQRIAVVPQDEPPAPGYAVEEMVWLGRAPFRAWLGGPSEQDRAIVRWAMQATGADELADRWLDELSGGEQQRVRLARAMAQQPRLLLLDEPTASLDVHYQVGILDLVRQQARDHGLGVLAALHDLQLAALYADRVVLLLGGRVLASGSPAQVLTPELLEAAFRQTVVVTTHPTHGVPLVALAPTRQ